MSELDPQVKALLEQFQANAAQHPAPATPLSAKEKIVATRQRMGAFAPLRVPSEPSQESKISTYRVLRFFVASQN